MEPSISAYCSRCKQNLPVAEFNPRGSGRTGLQAWCKPCMKESARLKRREKRGLPADADLKSGGGHPIGAVVTHRGYRLVRTAAHHRADRWGWVFQHILVAEDKYGIRITRDFTIHHVNGDRSDNRPENLELRWGNHGKGADVLPGLLRNPQMRAIARSILSQYDD